jgi:hypothetical protein
VWLWGHREGVCAGILKRQVTRERPGPPNLHGLARQLKAMNSCTPGERGTRSSHSSSIAAFLCRLSMEPSPATALAFPLPTSTVFPLYSTSAFR